MKKSQEILKQYWGYDDFRPLQGEIVDSITYGHDTLAILPTGGGKSICYQVPGLSLEGITIVVSPLIALMEDQVQALRKKGVSVELITSGMSYREIDIALDNAIFGNTSFLYTSPERLQSPLFIERCKRMKVSLIAVDEAHCISEWGNDFRPSYRQIISLRELHPNAPLIALTASATQHVQDDIIQELKLRNPKIIKGDLSRSNLIYRCIASTNKEEDILDVCKRGAGKTGIVYCQTRKSVKHIVQHLRAGGIKAGFYHGGLSPEDRKTMMKSWMTGQVDVMVATNAFGMGIDKPDVRYVLHFEVPGNIEAYYQEAGRAGRDGNDAVAIAYWAQKDLTQLNEHIQSQYPEKEKIKRIYSAICNYLKIANGSGEQETYNFDIQKFHQSFNFSVSDTYYALKLLQLSGYIDFNENSFHPTRLKFAIGSSALYKFQVTHDSLTNTIALLTRSYPGIHDRFIRIDEMELAKRVKVSKDEFRKQLERLEQYGVIDITYQSILPKVTFLIPRVDEQYLSIPLEIYDHRKELEQAKLEAMSQYLSSRACRQQLIAIYFDSECPPCGKCDNCVAKAKMPLSKEQIAQKIIHALPASLQELIDIAPKQQKEIEESLRDLILNEKITYSDSVYRNLTN